MDFRVNATIKMYFLLLLAIFSPIWATGRMRIKDTKCSLSLVETIPIGLTYPAGSPSHLETGDVWLDLINSATVSIDIASLYWTLRGTDVMENPDPSSEKGEAVFAALMSKADKVKMRLAVSAAAEDLDSAEFAKAGAEVREVNMPLLVGAGVLHTKLILVDGRHFYVGSANTDWRSLAQVKEMGVLAKDCPNFAEDIGKIFAVYWMMGNASSVPSAWPENLATDINVTHPALISIEDKNYNVFLSSSPPPFSTPGRTEDLHAILTTIRNAKKFVHIAVMDYFPTYLYSEHHKFWPFIDDALRRAYVSRGVSVKLLISKWAHTKPTILPFLKSLAALSGLHNKTSIEVKWFTVPSNETMDKIPYARVNHNKYMVTDLTASIGTSNWSADYFTDTAGISFVISPALVKHRRRKNQASTGFPRRSQNMDATADLRTQLSDVFMRDWNSVYASSLE